MKLETADNKQPRRTGDTVSIVGSYQYDALRSRNPVQRYWHLNKQILIDRFLRPEKNDCVLDVGCGSGVISDLLASYGAQVTGVDGSEQAIAFARKFFRRPALAFERALVDEDYACSTIIDKIYCLELIEHIYEEQAEQMLLLFNQYLRTGGKVLLTTPNYHGIWGPIEWIMDRFKLAPQFAEHQHVARYHRKKLVDICERAGFKVVICGTTCFSAPWLAAASFPLANRLNRIETGAGNPFGAILFCVLEKKTNHDHP